MLHLLLREDAVLVRAAGDFAFLLVPVEGQVGFVGGGAAGFVADVGCSAGGGAVGLFGVRGGGGGRGIQVDFCPIDC